ncbi:MAG TPA: hypothetical protein VIR29_13250 [Anseongella sp.]
MRTRALLVLLAFISVAPGIYAQRTSETIRKNSFWNKGKEFFDLQDITPAGIHHCILVAKDGRSDYSGLAAGRKGTASEGMIYLMYARGRGKTPALTPRIARFNLPWLAGGELTGDGKLPTWILKLK